MASFEGSEDDDYARWLAEQEAAAAPPPAAAPSGGISTDYIAQLYRDVLGREASQSEIAGHVMNPGGESGLKQHFMESPEYAAAHPGTTAQWQDVGGQVMNLTDPGARTDQWSGRYDIAPHEGGWERLEGFDFKNLADPQMQTLKYQFARIAQDYPPTPEGLKALVNDPRFKASFPKATLVAGGAGDQISFDGSGRSTDVGLRFDPKSNTGAKWWWGGTQGGAGGGAGGGGTGAGGGPVLGAGGRAMGGGGGFGGGGIGGGAYPGAPGLDLPTYGGFEEFSYDTPAPAAFVAPTQAEAAAEPGYQFRLDQGRKALEQSAAGRGVLRTGGTLKGLEDYAQNFASNEYGNVYNRRAGEHDRAYKEYLGGFDVAADTWQKNYGASLDKYDRAYQETLGEFNPKMREWELGFQRNARENELLFGREWDQYKLDRELEMQKYQMIFNAGAYS